MATIGSFKKVGNDFQGEIVTLSLQARGVRIVAEANRSNENAPSHRIYVGRAEIGAAWSKRSEEGRDYLSLKLDDPSFNAPIYANLFDDEGGEGYTLLWSRPRQERRLRLTPKPRPSSSGGASCFKSSPTAVTRRILSQRPHESNASVRATCVEPSVWAPRALLFPPCAPGRVRRSAASTPKACARRSTTSIPAA